MKIKSITPLNDGADKFLASTLWDKIEKFASYSFNKSHAVEYSIISYWAMWLKINYPAEFFAASLSVVGESKLTEIVKDAQKHGVYVVPPDINESGMDFEIGYDKVREQRLLYTPFNRLKGLSDNTAKAILDARERLKFESGKLGTPKEKFDSKEEFLRTVNKTKCNKRHQEVLERTGAFASIEPGLPARHPDRLRDQMELMPGLVVETIKSDRDIVVDKTIKIEVVKLMNEIRSCDKCDLAGGVHPMISLGATPKFMVVTDNPNWSEEQAVKMFKGKACEFTAKALDAAGLSAKQAYFTALVKSPKSERQLTTEQIGSCSQYLAREIEILKPPVIVALGSSVVRYFYPEAKGGIMDLAGQVIYMPKLDASVVFGISPLMIHHDPDKQNSLDDTFQKVLELIE